MNKAQILAIGAGYGVLAWVLSNREEAAAGLQSLGSFLNASLQASTQGILLKLDKSFESKNWLNAGKVPDELRFDPQVKAFMRMLRHGETSQGPEAYYMLNGGDLYMKSTGYPADLIDVSHPNVKGKRGSTEAAGAYQFMFQTWKEMAKLNGMQENPQMSPVNQEKLALAAIAYRGALPAVLRGDLKSTYGKLKKEWTSLPGARENTKSEESFRKAFVDWGGVVAAGQ